MLEVLENLVGRFEFDVVEILNNVELSIFFQEIIVVIIWFIFNLKNK